MSTQYITEEIGKVVEAMRPLDVSYGQPMVDYLTGIKENSNLSEKPFYMYGHRLEISNRLLQKGKDSTYKFKKYPLIALRMNIPATRVGNLWTYRLNVAIIASTEKNLNAEQRMEQVFYPVLFPLYYRFLKELKDSGLFLFTNRDSNEVPDHEAIVKPFWGVTETGEGTQKNVFADPLDCIEIENLELSQRVKIC